MLRSILTMIDASHGDINSAFRNVKNIIVAI
jgi:hypothetical protein